MIDEELVERLRDMDGDSMSIKTLDEAADRIEALTKERDEAMQLLQTLSNMNGDLSRDMYKTKLLLAKAEAGLREIAGECGCSTARTTLAEIENSEAVTLGEKG
jgi:hypothetical protein